MSFSKAAKMTTLVFAGTVAAALQCPSFSGSFGLPLRATRLPVDARRPCSARIVTRLC